MYVCIIICNETLLFRHLEVPINLKFTHLGSSSCAALRRFLLKAMGAGRGGEKPPGVTFQSPAKFFFQFYSKRGFKAQKLHVSEVQEPPTVDRAEK